MLFKKVELLAPAGSCESLRAAVCAGADAVYIGGSRFGARAYAQNPDEKQLLEAIDYVHLHGRKIYMTVNTLLKDDEMDELYGYLLPYYERGVDAVIIQDLGVLDFVKEYFPGLPVHVSTQMTVANALGAKFFKSKGVERIVPARELSLREIRRMKELTGLEIECFVHGALCYCYSGQCLMSSMIGGRSGNRGQCAQPCRLPYVVSGGKPVDILSLKDLCTVEMLPRLMDAGIDSFKIEGRMKQPEYVYTVVSVYRKYMDLYFEGGAENFRVSREDLALLQGAYKRRGYCEGYYEQHNGKNMISFNRPAPGTKDQCPAPRDYKIKEKINGEFILFPESSAKISLEYKGKRIKCEGAVVQKAQKQPLTEERVRRQIEKTGRTEVEFGKLKITMPEDVFLPMQALNELRREGIRLLCQEITADYRRKAAAKKVTFQRKEDCAPGGTAGIRLSVLVSDAAQLRAALDTDRIAVVYVDSPVGFTDEVKNLIISCRKTDSCRKRIFLAMPFIFRERVLHMFEEVFSDMEELYDGVLIRNWESYMWLAGHGYQREIISDHNLYVFNQRSKAFLESEGIVGYTAPVELNSRELQKLGIQDATFIAYGYQPVMISANCILKNTKGCTQKQDICVLLDRYHKKFAVKNVCGYCYNIIYNSTPLMLLHQAEEIKNLHPAYVRLDFTTEPRELMMEIIQLYSAVFLDGQSVKMPEMEYTNGHFKRGVK